jgi:hypothetical protein
VRPGQSLIPLALFALAFSSALLALRQPTARVRSAELIRAISAQSVSASVTPNPATAAPAEPIGLNSNATVLSDPAPPIDALESLEPSPSFSEAADRRSSLRIAAADDDPDLSARAQEEYEALIDREDP